MNKTAVIIGAGPNGYSAAIQLQKHGIECKIIEANNSPSGGMSTCELTLDGLKHDTCSAVHPMAILSPAFKSFSLEKHGLTWVHPEISVGHPLSPERSVYLNLSIENTAQQLGKDCKTWISIFNPLKKAHKKLLASLLNPTDLNPFNKPIEFYSFGLKGLLSARTFSSLYFKEEEAKALFAGCAAHSILPLNFSFTASVGLMFVLTAHLVDWPVVKGGTENLALALKSKFQFLGGTIVLNEKIESFNQIPDADFIIFNTSPKQLIDICDKQLPKRYKQSLSKYNYGPGVFKIDYALRRSIPWSDPKLNNCSTIHLGGTIDEISASEKDAWNGKINNKPFVMICQQSEIDSTRSEIKGYHTGYAYCHVPFNSDIDMTSYIESRIETYAPGFRDIIIKRHITTPRDLYTKNANYIGGVIAGGAATINQLVFRPTFRLNPYSTPNKKIFICSASTPPGGGVHGMGGYNCANRILKSLKIDPT